MGNRYRRRVGPWLLIAAAGLGGRHAHAQSLLERSPNFSGAWVPRMGTVQFNFAHRFSRGPAPARKVTGFPTLLLSAGLPARTSAGVVYTTNSTLVNGYPNEWELFARVQPLAQADAGPIDVAVQAGYDLAADGFAGELALARREGPVRLLGVARLLAALDESESTRVALGGGLALRVTSHIAVAGDVVTLTGSSAAEERAAWSAGLHLAIPNSPHTLSLHASNVPATTLHAASRGTSETRFGFEFTVPVTLARYFGRRAQPPEAAAEAGAAVHPDDGVRRIEIREMAFGRGTIEVTVGTTVEWVNRDFLAHTVTGADRSFDSGLIEPGSRWRRTFTEPGTYQYVCTPHPFMRGVVKVSAAQ